MVIVVLPSTQVAPMTDKDSADTTESGDTYYKGKPLHEKINPVFAWLIVVAAFFLGGLFAMANVSTGHGVWFLIVGSIAACPFWVILTESGLNWLNNLDSYQTDSDNTQSVNIDSSSEREAICPNCGWKNPQENSYCHDCGSKIFSEE